MADKFLNFLDMFDGGGRGASGAEFEGGCYQDWAMHYLSLQATPTARKKGSQASGHSRGHSEASVQRK